MSDKKRIILSDIQDSLVLYYGCDEHQIDSSTLVNSLNGLKEALEVISQNFNPNYQVVINIEAISPGSFKVKISKALKYLSEFFKEVPGQAKQNTIPTLALLSTVLITHSCNSPSTVVNNTYNIVENKNVTEVHVGNIILEETTENYNYCNKLVQENDKVKKGLNKHFKALYVNKKITSFEVQTQLDEGDILFQASAAEFESLIASDKDEVRTIEEEAILTIFSPVLSNEKRKWEFTWHGSHISAYVTDKDFLEKMKSRVVGFKQGDSVNVILKRKQKFDTRSKIYLDQTLTVTKVLSEPHQTISEQLDLIDT